MTETIKYTSPDLRLTIPELHSDINVDNVSPGNFLSVSFLRCTHQDTHFSKNLFYFLQV